VIVLIELAVLPLPLRRARPVAVLAITLGAAIAGRSVVRRLPASRAGDRAVHGGGAIRRRVAVTTGAVTALALLGADSPAATLLEIDGSLRPARVVLASVRAETYLTAGAMLSDLARRVPVSLAGPGAAATPVADVGAEVLEGDPVTEAVRLCLGTGRPAHAAPGT
jgi:hypothetical protein